MVCPLPHASVTDVGAGAFATPAACVTVTYISTVSGGVITEYLESTVTVNGSMAGTSSEPLIPEELARTVVGPLPVNVTVTAPLESVTGSVELSEPAAVDN